MVSDIKERVLKEARYIAETGATVRATAKVFHYSKSTIHKDVTERLFCINKGLYKKVRSKLNKNLEERHIRGGNATREKYLKLNRK
ncbi:MAG: sporulation transcriptional regulator SpoIIID [Clostridia bacterium]|nr:sporulation transcriptional regulator SpoIIID [Clostridia bacterium]